MAYDDPRLSGPALRVLRLMIDDPRADWSGAAISKAARVGPGTLYPMLARFENAGWMSSRWETVDPRDAGRPRRRFYSLTGVGRAKALLHLSDVQLGGFGGRLPEGAR